MLLLLLSLWERASILLPPQSLSLILYCAVITTSTRSALIGEKLWAGARVSRVPSETRSVVWVLVRDIPDVA
jgi:hypothetical protein